MSQEPWNEEIYEAEENSRKSRTKKGKANTLVFSILVGLFVIIVAAITILAIYLANGGSNTDSTKEFYNANTITQVEKSANGNQGQVKQQTTTLELSTTSSASETTTTNSSVPSTNADATLTVQAGEGQASIAERAGISISELERLNPDKMSTGSWLAHPGDTVRVK